MNRNLININIDDYPEKFHSLLKDADIYDSSCSENARVIFIDKDNGYFLKSSFKHSLKSEADMTRYFSYKNLSSLVIDYISEEKDWLLTERIKGEDCTFSKYLEKPEMLCDILADILKKLHNSDYSDCPICDRNKKYIDTAFENYRKGIFDPSYLLDEVKDFDAKKAIEYIDSNKSLLKSDTLIHGDYCLPNIILDDFKFSGFIDLGNSGVGDRHIDIFWAIWTLEFNLKTNKYKDRFIDFYGREKVDFDILNLISVIETFG